MSANRSAPEVEHVYAPTAATRRRLRGWHFAIVGCATVILARLAFAFVVTSPEARDFGGLAGVALVALIAVAVIGGFAGWARYRSQRFARGSTAPYVRVSSLQLSQLANSSILADSVARVKWKRLDASTAMGVNGVLTLGHVGITWMPVRGSRRLGADAWQIPWSAVQSAELAGRHLFLSLADGATIRLGVRPKLVAPLLFQFGVPGTVQGALVG